MLGGRASSWQVPFFVDKQDLFSHLQGELWHMFMEAQNSPEGIPSSLGERKVQELKIANASRQPDQSFAKATEIDWQYRYKSLTGGRYGKVEPSYAVKVHFVII